MQSNTSESMWGVPADAARTGEDFMVRRPVEIETKHGPVTVTGTWDPDAGVRYRPEFPDEGLCPKSLRHVADHLTNIAAERGPEKIGKTA